MFKKKQERLEIVSKGEKTFKVINYMLLAVIAICSIYPLVYVLSASVSRGSAVDAGKVVLAPIGFTLDAYKAVLADKWFWAAYGNTFFYTIVGTIFSMFVSISAAYVLSRKRFKFRKQFNLLLAITIWFNVGFIPLYLNYRSLGADNSRWMIIFEFGVHAFNILLLRNYFESIPDELEEAANIDGANDFQILYRIFIPVSRPAITTVWLYYAIDRWNGWFWASVLLKQQDKVPLQVYLKQKIIDSVLVADNARTIASGSYSFTTLTYAIVICSIIPIVLVYPYIQKHFSKGILVGGVKE
ncbi:carbohydrate ABC transporter permease [Clostridium sp. CF012]|uniref:carbohydrate ABC transporter permease n=1 Tax=Clostridium sp. CF012 TaxID=2843319 RepID=UPI001C0AD4DE|nr:carbohydrate ABC transporter permease [Clostridium sp. CF012]MBU3142903.1 carbohydrate ABC transporter permease [Clostridium sp. CF012]